MPTSPGTPPDQATTIEVEAAKVQPGDRINGRRVRDVVKPKPARARNVMKTRGPKLPALSFANGTVTIRFEDGPPAYKWPKALVEVQRGGDSTRWPRVDSAAAKPAPKTRAGKSPEARIALDLIRQQPGITIPELADTMGIHQNSLYRVLPALADDGKIVKNGRGWHILDQAEDQAA